MPGASRRQMSSCGAVRRAFGTGLRGRTDSSPEKRRGLDGTLPHCSAPSFHPRLCHIIKLERKSKWRNSKRFRAIWRNVVAKQGLGALISEAQIADYATKYATSAGGIATVLQSSRQTLAAQKHPLRPCQGAWESAQDRAL